LKEVITLDIIISTRTGMPIYEQITSQIKAMIMSGELSTGAPLPSMRALAKSIHVSVITVQRAYEDLQRDGFIDTVVGRGSFVSAQNNDFIQEEQQRRAESHLHEAAVIGRTNGISYEKLAELLKIFYHGEE
jgi:GntR family transcriptional regulator